MLAAFSFVLYPRLRTNQHADIIYKTGPAINRTKTSAISAVARGANARRSRQSPAFSFRHTNTSIFSALLVIITLIYNWWEIGQENYYTLLESLKRILLYFLTTWGWGHTCQQNQFCVPSKITRVILNMHHILFFKIYLECWHIRYPISSQISDQGS